MNSIRSCLVIFIILGVIFGIAFSRVRNELGNYYDLGIKSDNLDFDSFISELGLDIKTDPDSLCLTCPIDYKGSQNVNVSISDEQATAWLAEIGKEKGPLKKPQVKFDKDLVLLSSNFEYAGQSFPVFATGTIDVDEFDNVNLNIDTIKVGVINPPKKVKEKMQNSVNDFVNKKVDEMENFKVETLEIEAGYINFSGTIPQTIIGME